MWRELSIGRHVIWRQWRRRATRAVLDVIVVDGKAFACDRGHLTRRREDDCRGTTRRLDCRGTSAGDAWRERCRHHWARRSEWRLAWRDDAAMLAGRRESAGRRAIELGGGGGVVARGVKTSILGRLDRRDIVVVGGLGDSVEDIDRVGERRVGGIVRGGRRSTARCQWRRLTWRMRLRQ